MQVIIGVLFHAVGACCAALCYTPQKRVSGWSWETYWLAQAVVCWLVLPLLGAWLLIPHLFAVLAETPDPLMWRVFGLGAAYGIGGTAFGIAIRYIGYSLTYAVSVGLSCVIGTLLPPLVHGELGHVFQQPGAWFIGWGVGMGTLGIALCGTAGRFKEVALAGARSRSDETAARIDAAVYVDAIGPESGHAHGQPETGHASGQSESGHAHGQPPFDLAKGLPLCLLAGILSAVYGFAIDQGQPIADIAAKYGAGNFQGEVIYIFSNSGAFVTTLLYCIYLHVKNRSFGEYARPGALKLNFLLAGLTGCLWYGQFFFYALGHIRMGSYKFTSWAIHMTMLVMFSALTGLALKEWAGAGRVARGTLGWAMGVLLTAILLLCYGNYI